MSLLLDVRRGSQTPRIANYPPHDFSAAPEVIEHAKRAKLFLDPWQEFVLTHGLGQHLITSDEQKILTGDWTAKKNSVWVPRQNGKGGIIEALELAWLFLPGFEVDEITHSAHEHKTSKKAYERMERLCRRTPSFHRKVLRYRQANGERMIILKDGRKLEYHTRSDTAVRGFSSPRLILDEAQEITAEQMAAIQPTVSAMPNWQMWFFGTPPRVDDAWVYGLKADGEAREARLAHFDWGADLDMSKADDRARSADPELWYACNPAMGIRIELETVEDEFKPSGLGAKFAQERLGVWLPRRDSNDVIDFKQWLTLHDPDSKRHGDISIGVDVGVFRDWAAITVYGTREDALGHGQLVDYRPGIEWVIPSLAKMKDKLDPLAIGMGRGTYESLKVDLTGIGVKLPRDPDKPKRGDLLVMNAVDMAAGCGQLIDAVRQRAFRVVPAPQLDEAVAGAVTRQSGDTIAWARKDSEAEISPLGSFTAARFAHLTRLLLVRKRSPATPMPDLVNTQSLFRPTGRLKI